ncbi:aldo/keto reductase [Cytobacillus purgationiresistens]|uniref:Aryl-alcohol dehydrogenase-like predicted oxidoreductase n=1 Tax=Cytobacillus purgationiresistens TaxID=863449 RepID=A0ABU0ADE9_9BACI|nr:aldo/keto reductase [Cytobacillus purgationiresistens]MDQ0268822.1 aryl-alcohol dehydrogenase-like predicted oxidoreductase [Cytobacillus purgationiresistens]
MGYRVVGKTGIKVSNLCFGTMSFGGIADEAESKQMFKLCRDRGVNFFDTANVYNDGRAEEILGKCIADCRNEIVLTSKVGFPVGKDVNASGASRRHIFQSVEESLRRLGTDRLEFYFIHRFDEDTDIEETLKALDDLQRQGKILFPAVSNWAAWQIMKALGISERSGLSRFELIQPMYNLVKRQAEVEILPLAQAEQLGVISYSPLGGGLLTGKYRENRKPAQGRLVEQLNYEKRYGEQQYYSVADRFVQFSVDHGYDPATLAVAWVNSHPAITAPIIGARYLKQLELSLAAAELQIGPELHQQIAALSVTPPLSTDHSREENLFKK